jgi:DNA-3-methyladenine glycosylase I
MAMKTLSTRPFTRKELTDGLVIGPDGVARCWWPGDDELYVRYHDHEWGMPQGDDRRLFEKICLEGFQAGLSWLTILRKREAFRKAFVGFDFARIARWGDREVERLLRDEGIIRHRGKIESAINNARRAIDLAAEQGSLAAYFWRWQPPAKERPKALTRTALCKLGATPTATALSKDLKKRGWTFVGGTTVYAFMQAMGLVDDHVQGCAARPRVEASRREFMVKIRA